MNIIEAAKAMKEGKNIARDGELKYKADGDEIMVSAQFKDGRWSSWSMAWYDGAFCSIGELLADDWEIVE